MKSIVRFILFIGGLLAAPFWASAQADFAPIGAKWYYEWAHVNFPTEGKSMGGYILQESVADTVIHGVTARKLQRTSYGRDNQNVIHSGPISSIYVHATADTVFYFQEELDRFLPLYIFNVQAGDTMVHRAPPEYAQFFTDTSWKILVDSVVTKSYNNHPVKVVYNSSGFIPGTGTIGVPLSGPYYQYFGLVNGHLSEYDWSYPAGAPYYSYRLRCYQDANFDVHFWDGSVACDSLDMLPTAISDLDYLSGKLSVYPNPSTGDVYILLDQIDIQSVEVLDMLGRKVLLQQQATDNAPVEVRLDGFSKGTYILRITTKDKGSVHRKIVLQ